MNEQKQHLSLTTKIMLGLILGACVGGIFKVIPNVENYVAIKYFFTCINAAADLFLSSLRMLVVPVIFVSIVHGTLSLTDITVLGRVAGKTIFIYTITTIIAISLGLFAALLVKPGANTGLVAAIDYIPPQSTSFYDVLVNLIPSNPIKAMATGDTIQIIVFAIFLGISIALAGEKAKPVIEIFRSLNEIIAKLVEFIMSFSHYGIFFLTAKLFKDINVNAIGSLLMYICLTYAVMFFHMILVYSFILKFVGGLNPIIFFKKIKDVLVFSFSTASSNATIPVTMNAMINRCGVSTKISSFTIPLGSTINMDGTSIMQGIATIFIAQAYNIPLGITDYLVVILTASLASVGTAGVPSSGVIMLAMVLQKAGLPVDGIALIIGVDRLIDMLRTSVNVTGDCLTACIVAKSENELDIKAFNDLSCLENNDIDLHHINPNNNNST